MTDASCSNAMLSFHIGWRSLICMSPSLSVVSARHCHKTKHLYSRRHFPSCSYLNKQPQNLATLWPFCYNDTWLCSIFVWMDLAYIKLPFVSVLNYSESNCYQIKSQEHYYPVIQSWQPDQSCMSPMVAGKSYFVQFIRCVEMFYLLIIWFHSN